MLSDAVTSSDIASIVSRATGIPVHDMLRGERQKLLHLERKSALKHNEQSIIMKMVFQRSCPSAWWARSVPCMRYQMRSVKSILANILLNNGLFCSLFRFAYLVRDWPTKSARYLHSCSLDPQELVRMSPALKFTVKIMCCNRKNGVMQNSCVDDV